jgi:ribosome-associated protein
MREVPIRGDMIRLGQFLKHSGLADSGAEARLLLTETGVTVNGEVEARRGRQLRPGDVVELGDQAIRVVGDAA